MRFEKVSLTPISQGPYVVTGLNPVVICWYLVSGNNWKHLWVFLTDYSLTILFFNFNLILQVVLTLDSLIFVIK